MRAQLLHLACAGLLVLLLPHVKADCASRQNNCTTEVNATIPSPSTSDEKCRFLALYKVCLEKDSSCTNASAETSAKKTTFTNLVCVDDACTSSGGECTGTNQECNTNKCACKAAYKKSEGICVAKMINDTCNPSTTGDCGSTMDCTNNKCTCKSGQGDNGKGECATNCALGYKGTVATSCTPKMINDTCSSGTTGDCGANMDCPSNKCTCKSGQGDNGKGECAASCALGYKGTVATSCTLKRPGDNCTAGQNQTCPASMYCSAGVCACPSPQKDNGLGVCAVNCAASYGDNGRGQCATTCANGLKGNVGNCTEKQVSDDCTASDNSTCGTNQWCRGVTGNATCACVPSHTSGTNRLCVVKKPGDLCTAGDDTTCGPNQKCKADLKCGCQDKYQESADKTQCVTAGAAGLLLSLALHFLPLAAVLAITRWL